MNAGNTPKPFVLVVDDEPLIRWSLSEGLGDGGYPVRQAETAAEAMAAIVDLREQPLVVLLDLRLPDVADVSFALRIRAARPDAPLIMMTAHATTDDASEALAAGVFCVVGKPFDVGEMVRLVSRA